MQLMFPEIIGLLIISLCIVLFIMRPIPNAATACLGCLLFALTGICTIQEAFSGFSNSTVLLMFGMMVVGIAMMDTGAARLISNYVERVSGGNEKTFIFYAGITSVALSMFLSNTAVIAIFLPIIESVSSSNKNMKRQNLTLPVTMGAMFGGVCTLVGSTPQLTANGILSKMTGLELQMFDFFIPGIFLMVIYMIFVLTIGYRFGNQIWGGTQENTTSNSMPNSNGEIIVDKRKILTMILIFILTIVMFIGGWIPTATTAILAALLCIITKCTDQKSIFKKMDWSVVFVLAGCLGLASGLTSSGAGELMSGILSNIFKNSISPVLVFAFFVFLTMVISNFITNSTAVVIILPIALSLCIAHGYNAIPFTLGIVYAANLAFSTPLANAQTAMTLVAGYKFSDYIRYTWILDILIFIGIVAIVPFCFPLV